MLYPPLPECLGRTIHTPSTLHTIQRRSIYIAAGRPLIILGGKDDNVLGLGLIGVFYRRKLQREIRKNRKRSSYRKFLKSRQEYDQARVVYLS